jgi:histidinol phosphatase-like PHP family hydrolase
MSHSFVHLHNHTEYSMLDGAAKVKHMFAEAQRLEMPAIGMTDHGNMFGASEFYNASTDVGIKPIIGVEAYIAPGSRFDTKRILWGDPGQKGDDVSGVVRGSARQVVAHGRRDHRRERGRHHRDHGMSIRRGADPPPVGA